MSDERLYIPVELESLHAQLAAVTAENVRLREALEWASVDLGRLAGVLEHVCLEGDAIAARSMRACIDAALERK